MKIFLKSLSKKILFVIALLLIAIAIGELYFRYNPQLTPQWYKSYYMPNAVEVYYPGTLTNTPLNAVPIPYDLGPKQNMYIEFPVTVNMDNASENPDLIKYSSMSYNIDSLGFMNPTEVENPDIVFIGDSLSWLTGLTEPEGLLIQLQQATNLSIFNVSVPGIGPDRERWLLNNVALPLNPKAVIWFFSATTDLDDVKTKRDKSMSYADVSDLSKNPKLIFVDMIFKYFHSSSFNFLSNNVPKEHQKVLSLDPFNLKNNKNQKIWFDPEYLVTLFDNNDQHPGWKDTKEILKQVSTDMKNRNVAFLVVYVPSKPEVYLPYIEEDKLLFYQTYTNKKMLNPDSDDMLFAENHWNAAMENKDSFVTMFLDFCKLNDITCISLKPSLESLAQKGELAYFSSDPHWNEIGQQLALEPILTWLKEMHLLEVNQTKRD